MKQYYLETKNDKAVVSAEDWDHAFAKYFRGIIDKKVPIEKIGNIVMLYDGNVKVAFRTAPLLWKLGYICTDCAVQSIANTLSVTEEEAMKLLAGAAKKDARLIPLIEELKVK